MHAKPQEQIKISSSFLKQFFDIRAQYLSTMVTILIALFKERTTNVQALSLVIQDTVQTASVYKRLLRFVGKVRLDPQAVITCIMTILQITTQDQLILIMDRTYWTFGKSHQNFLYLAILYRGYAIPIDFVLCSNRKKGHCSFEDRQILLDRFITMFGVESIDYLTADREFMGGKWLRHLASIGVRYVQRLKENGVMIQNKRGAYSKLADLAKDLKPGEMVRFGQRKICKKNTFIAHVTILKTMTGDIVALAHDESIADPCYSYRFRWCIEVVFRSMKSYGFNMEDSAITKTERLETVYRTVSIACACAVVVGEAVAAVQPITLKKHGYKAICIIKSGINHILTFLSRHSSGNFLCLQTIICSSLSLFQNKALHHHPPDQLKKISKTCPVD